jgi:hypothetical protein
VNCDKLCDRYDLEWCHTCPYDVAEYAAEEHKFVRACEENPDALECLKDTISCLFTWIRYYTGEPVAPCLFQLCVDFCDDDPKIPGCELWPGEQAACRDDMGWDDSIKWTIFDECRESRGKCQEGIGAKCREAWAGDKLTRGESCWSRNCDAFCDWYDFDFCDHDVVVRAGSTGLAEDGALTGEQDSLETVTRGSSGIGLAGLITMCGVSVLAIVEAIWIVRHLPPVEAKAEEKAFTPATPAEVVFQPLVNA